MTPEEYLEIERKAERKIEFYRGEMFDIDEPRMRTKLAKDHPDVIDVRGKPQAADSHDDTLLTRPSSSKS
jgi:hypothetical protein